MNPVDLRRKNKKLVERVQQAEQKLVQVTSEHQKELNRLLTELKELKEWKERASRNDVANPRFTNELNTWKDRAVKAEAETQRLENKLKEFEDRALKPEGHTGGFRSRTPVRQLPRVTVYLVNPSESYINYSYEDNGETIQDFVVPGGKSEILCVVQQQYIINISSGALRGLVRQVFHHDNHTLVLPNWLT